MTTRPEHPPRRVRRDGVARCGGDASAATRPRRPSTRPEAALRLDGVVAGYGEVEVLHGVDLDVAPGTIVALLGANGAGKSTLCAVASGLVAPTQGRILLDGA